MKINELHQWQPYVATVYAHYNPLINTGTCVIVLDPSMYTRYRADGRNSNYAKGRPKGVEVWQKLDYGVPVMRASHIGAVDSLTEWEFVLMNPKLIQAPWGNVEDLYKEKYLIEAERKREAAAVRNRVAIAATTLSQLLPSVLGYERETRNSAGSHRWTVEFDRPRFFINDLDCLEKLVSYLAEVNEMEQNYKDLLYELED